MSATRKSYRGTIVLTMAALTVVMVGSSASANIPQESHSGQSNTGQSQLGPQGWETTGTQQDTKVSSVEPSGWEVSSTVEAPASRTAGELANLQPEDGVRVATVEPSGWEVSGVVEAGYKIASIEPTGWEVSSATTGEILTAQTAPQGWEVATAVGAPELSGGPVASTEDDSDFSPSDIPEEAILLSVALMVMGAGALIALRRTSFGRQA